MCNEPCSQSYVCVFFAGHPDIEAGMGEFGYACTDGFASTLDAEIEVSLFAVNIGAQTVIARGKSGYLVRVDDGCNGLGQVNSVERDFPVRKFIAFVAAFGNFTISCRDGELDFLVKTVFGANSNCFGCTKSNAITVARLFIFVADIQL